jgi:ESS family glutamate:Na+ symporter
MAQALAPAAAVAVLLFLGHLIHGRFAVFQKIYVPASVIAGIIGLVGFRILAPILSASVWGEPFAKMTESLRGWPAYLIATVFAAMLLQPAAGRRRRTAMRAVLCEGLMVGVIALGQTAVGLLLTWLVIQPFYDVPNSFGMLVETGLAGGHGTAAAMGQVYSTPEINFPSGLDLGMLMATSGLVWGMISGIFLINLVVRNRRSWAERPCIALDRLKNDPKHPHESVDEPNGGLSPPPRSTVSRYAMQAVCIAAAFMIGLALQRLVKDTAAAIDARAATAARVTDDRRAIVDLKAGDDLKAGESSLSVNRLSVADAPSPLAQKLKWSSLVGGFPLFIYTLFGGLLVWRWLKRTGGGVWLDGLAGARISSWAMDLLVVAAIATLNLEAVATFFLPLTILFLGGALWSISCLLVIAPRILPRPHWFELGLINYGMSTGTTATGFVLLRLIDPELQTDAAKEYALAAPLSAPLVGGGLVTIGLPLLVLERIPIGLSTLLVTVVVLVLYLIARRLRRDITDLHTA